MRWLRRKPRPTTVAGTADDDAAIPLASAPSGLDESADRAAAEPSPAGPPRVVALLPPLLNTRYVMMPLYGHLYRAGWKPRLFSYPSYSRDIPDNAARLATWLRALGESEVDVVAFSMGAILLRWAANHHEIPRLGRVVMLGPPNGGAAMADWLSDKLGPVYPLVWGRGALQLRRGDRGLCERAGQLPAGTQLGVIAGGRGNARGYNPLIGRDNDRTVAVAETIMPGMTDFAHVNATHTWLPLGARSRSLAVRFLKTGQFRERPAAEHTEPAPAKKGRS